jgi:hypothetical protein
MKIFTNLVTRVSRKAICLGKLAQRNSRRSRKLCSEYLTNFLNSCEMPFSKHEQQGFVLVVNLFYNNSNEIDDTAKSIAMMSVEMKMILSAPRLV